MLQPILDLTTLIKSLVQVIARNVSFQSSQLSQKDHQVHEMQFEMGNGERELRRRLDIVYRVFK